MTDIYDLFVVEEYEQNRQMKAKFYNVGTAFLAKSGENFNLQLAPGITVSGRLLMKKRQANAADAPSE